MAEKVTVMLLKVDLQCYKCCKKVKKVLCKFPQIRDQVYDEKSNTVRITVVCCSPEKIRDKLCCKGNGAIKSIEILTPPAKPKEPEKPKPAPAPAPEKPKEAEKPKPKEPEKPKQAPEKPKVVEKPKEAEKPKPAPEKPKPVPEKPKEAEKPKAPPAADKPKEAEKPKAPPAAEKPKEKPPEPKLPATKPADPVPVPAFPPAQVFQACCEPCYHGFDGGPCYQGQAWGAPPAPCYETYGRPVHDSWGGGGYRPCYNVNRCDYFCEENSQGCSIM